MIIWADPFFMWWSSSEFLCDGCTFLMYLFEFSVQCKLLIGFHSLRSSLSSWFLDYILFISFFLNGSTRDTYISNRMTYYLLIFSGKNQKYSSRKEIWLEDKQKPIIHHQDGWYTDAVTFRIKCYFEHA